MIAFRPDTSFPFLSLARSAGISYERVLQVSDMVIRRYMVGAPDLGIARHMALAGNWPVRKSPDMPEGET